MKPLSIGQAGQVILVHFAALVMFVGLSSLALAGHHGEVKKAPESKEAAPDIIDVAVSAGAFNTLATALEAAGLVETLKGEGPFTVFAPTDAAFSKLPEGTVESLLRPENKDKLVAILTYHVIAGKVFAADVVKLDSAKSVNGASLAIAVNERGVFLNQASVTSTDIEASNGVVHVIDEVVLPPNS